MVQEMLTSEQAQKLSNDAVYGRTQEQRAAYRAEQDRIQKAHRAWVEKEYETDVLHSATRLALYRRAWEAGRSIGFNRVEFVYRDLSDLVLVAIHHNSK